jgi:predicted ribosomally synthesized six-cysteine peptide SCIFF
VTGKGSEMKHIRIVSKNTMRTDAKNTGCRECQTSCQSACKTSCTVANQKCGKRR